MNKADLLKQAVRRQRAIPSRSEDLSLDMQDRLYVAGPNEEVVAALSGTANQLLFGRRGTGKTMILRQLLRDARPANPNGRYVAVFIQSQDFLRSPDVSDRDPVPIRARAYFREFLHQFGLRMLTVGDHVLADKGLLTRLGIAGNARKGILEDRILQLSTVLRSGVIVPMLGRSEHVEEIQSDDTTSVEAEEHGSVGLGVAVHESAQPSLSAHVQLAHRQADTMNRAESVSSHTQLRTAFDMGVPEIRVLLEEVASMLQLEQIMILLDEWQALQDCQAEFAEHIKSCFLGLNCVSIKIAAYRHICQFNNGGMRANFRGLEVGQDISIAGDSDLSPNAAETVPFFYRVLYRRLLLKEPDLANFYGDIEEFDYTLLRRDLFATTHAGDMLVRGSHGVLRDFLEAFNAVAGYLDDDLARNKARQEHVDRAYGELSRAIQENLHAADDVGGLLFEYIKPIVHATGAPFFFVSRGDDRWDAFLWELAEKRAIHPLSTESMPEGADVEWRGYEVSYGLFQEWRRAATFSKKTDADRFSWKDPKGLAVDDFQRYVLSMEKSPSSAINCVSCHRQFSTAEHSYLVKRLCPYCYTEQLG